METEEIVNFVKELKDMQSAYLKELEEYFEFIKYRNITRVSEIEHLLDAVLGAIQTDGALELYIRICSYYHCIDKEGAMDYAKYYLEIYGDDTVVRELEKIERKIKKHKKK